MGYRFDEILQDCGATMRPREYRHIDGVSVGLSHCFCYQGHDVELPKFALDSLDVLEIDGVRHHNVSVFPERHS